MFMKKNWPKFVQIDFGLDCFDKDWSDVLRLYQHDINLYIESFLDNMNSILDEHATLKRIDKCKLKFQSKPWITPAIQKFITVRNNLLKKLINAKDLQRIFKTNIKIVKPLKRNKICYNY